MMSLQFIFGNSGSGKSRYLYEQVIAGACENPNRNYIVLVPEQFTMQTQKELVRLHPRHGIMNIDVLSFGRLAHRIFEEVGGNRRIVLDDIGKSLLLRKAAGDMEGELKVLGSNIRRLGYISEVKSVISEFTQYDVGAEELERVMESGEIGPQLYWKLHDIQKLLHITRFIKRQIANNICSSIVLPDFISRRRKERLQYFIIGISLPYTLN